MAKKKPDLTDQQILQYILVGGDLGELSKQTNVSQKQLLRVLVTNPEIVSAFQQQAQADTFYGGLDTFAPEKWYSESSPEVNYVQAQYDQMEEPARNYATDYFNAYKLAGGNPIRVAELEKLYNDPAIVQQNYGIPQEAYSLLFEKVKEDAPKWYSQELEVQRKNADANYKAFQSRRKEADILAGETGAMAAMRQTTGFGELTDLPSPTQTFAQVARTKAGEKYKTEFKPDIKGKSASTVDRAFTAAAETPKYKQESAENARKRALYERGFLKAAAEKAGKKGTPYTETVKKVLPFIAARLNVEG